MAFIFKYLLVSVLDCTAIQNRLEILVCSSLIRFLSIIQQTKLKTENGMEDMAARNFVFVEQARLFRQCFFFIGNHQKSQTLPSWPIDSGQRPMNNEQWIRSMLTNIFFILQKYYQIINEYSMVKHPHL